jgi:AraC-type DNA-binding domain-containing proteins
MTWATIFLIKHRQSEPFRFAGISFAGITILMLYGFSEHIQCLALSRVVFLFYPVTYTLVPIVYIFYLHRITSPYKSIPLPAFLLLLIPVAQFLYSGYAFYISDPDLSDNEHFYAVANGTDKLMYAHHKVASIAREINAILKLTGLSAIIIVPVLFIPHMISAGISSGAGTSQQCNRFVMLLAVTFVVCITSLIYHFTASWRTFLEILWGTGFLFGGYLMYREPRCRLPISIPTREPAADDTSLTTRLIRYFETDKPWLNPELKITDVARTLATNRTYISDALHHGLKTNFNRFVNHYRIEEAKRLLANSKADVKMLEVAMQAGFNNYTTFFCAFRHETGKTPQEYAGKRKGWGET